MRSIIPGLYISSSYPPSRVRTVVAAIRRIPNWLLYEIHERDLWDDLFSHACIPLLYEEGDLKRLYNAAQREIYAFLKAVGYRKKRVIKPNGKSASLWFREFQEPPRWRASDNKRREEN